MAEEKAPLPKAGAARPEADAAGAAEAPKLPASFFSKLVRQPRCVTEGVCDTCGRCEH